MSTVTSKNSSRQTHKLKADRAFKIFFQRRLNRRFFHLVGLEQMTDEVFVDFFVVKLTFPLDFFYAIFENNIVVQVSADVEVPLEVNFAVRILRDDLFLVSKFFIYKSCNV